VLQVGIEVTKPDQFRLPVKAVHSTKLLCGLNLPLMDGSDLFNQEQRQISTGKLGTGIH